MTRQVQRIALGMFLLFALLFLNLNYLQVLRAEDLRDDNRNARGLIREYEIRRGSILVQGPTDPAEIARVERTDGPLRYLRRYSDGPLYAHLTGFYSFVFGRAQLEHAFNDFLVGSAPETFARNIADLLAGRERRGDDVISTIRPEVQAAARAALGERKGAVVALDPGTGAVLALWSYPTYDPNRLSSHDAADMRAYWDALNADPDQPLRSRATQEWYPPGSTFKIVTAAAGLEAGLTPETTFPDPVRQSLPQTSSTIGNFGGGTCNGGSPITLRRAFEASCNTTFAQIGLDVGAEQLIATAERFGLNHDWSFQGMPLIASRIPKELDPPQTAQSAIGQRDVRVTPLQMALIAAAVANDGVMMSPRVVGQIEDFAGRLIREYQPEPLSLPGIGGAQALRPETARILREFMTGVVSSGTGRRAAIPGVQVAGKTGTAQQGEGHPPTVWFVGFAPAEDARVAVAVVVEDGGDVGDEATGGAVAAPIARAVMEAVLASGPGGDG